MENRIPVKVLPVPKPYSTECGMCLEILTEYNEKLSDFAGEKGMEIRIISCLNQDLQD